MTDTGRDQSTAFVEESVGGYYKAVRHVALLCMAAHMLLILVFIITSVTYMAVVNIFSSLLYVVAYLMARQRKSDTAFLLGVSEVIIHSCFAVAILGWEAGFQLYIIITLPALFFPDHFKTSTRFAATSLLCLVYITLFYYSLNSAPVLVMSENLRIFFYCYNVIVTFLCIAILSYIVHSSVVDVKKLLIRSNEELALLARVDPLTKILNRRSMNDFLSFIMRKPHPMGFIMADIDHFKSVNDTHGHICGDMVLTEVSRVMADTMREGDRIARWGGEEFLAVITRGTFEGTFILAERMRKTVSEAKIIFNGREISVTVTLGVTIGGIKEGSALCINRADKALYHGKKSGRNNVVVWMPEMGD